MPVANDMSNACNWLVRMDITKQNTIHKFICTINTCDMGASLLHLSDPFFFRYAFQTLALEP